MIRTRWNSLAAVAALVAATPASAAEDYRRLDDSELRRVAFAGATVRLELGGRASARPEARLGLGLVDYRRGRSGADAGRAPPALSIAAGLEGGRLEFLAAGERLSQVQRRLGLAGSGSTALLLVGGLAAGALAVVLLTDGGDDDDDNIGNPCPPGVEVCAF